MSVGVGGGGDDGGDQSGGSGQGGGGGFEKHGCFADVLSIEPRAGESPDLVPPDGSAQGEC